MENETNKEVEVHEESSKMDGLKDIFWALVAAGVAYYFYTTMTKYENGQSISMNRILFIAYGILGKNITVGIISVISALMGFAGIKKLLKSE